MTPENAEIVIKDFLKEVRQRLDEAASIARAAEACAEAGNPEKGIEVVLDVDQLLYEADTLLNGATPAHAVLQGKTQELSVASIGRGSSPC